MTSFEVLNLFAAQIERHISSEKFATKVVITPSSIDEKGIVIKISLLKCYPQTVPARIKAQRMIRVRVQVSGTAESMTGLEQACAAVEALDDYCVCKMSESNIVTSSAVLLEDSNGALIPNTRIITAISPEDSFIDTPDSTIVQDVQDDRIATIYFPWEV